MSFIVNVLHRDFSLLVADRLVTTNGPTIISLGDLTIHAEKGAVITGFAKLRANADGSVALGMAGNAYQHLYLREFETSRGINDAISVVDSHVDRYMRFCDRKQFAGEASIPRQVGVLSFFDAETDCYFSLLYEFSLAHKIMRMQKAPNSRLTLIARGSGCKSFTSLKIEEGVNRLSAVVGTENDYDKCLKWLIPIYDDISKEDPSVGASIIAWVSLRSHPQFQEVYRS